MNSKCKWIWTKDTDRANDWVVFRKEFQLFAVPKNVEVKIAVESQYTMYVNGKLAVFCGGLPRGVAGSGYYDTVDISRLLKKGDNAIVIHAWYYTATTRDERGAGKPGLALDAGAIEILSDASFKVMHNPAAIEVTGAGPSTRMGGHNIGYDACKHIDKINETLCHHSDFVAATEVAEYGEEPYGTLRPRSIPNHRFGNPIKAKASKKVVSPGIVQYTVKLPYYMHVSPIFGCSADGNEKIEIRTDRYEVPGVIGNETDGVAGNRIEYICKTGVQSFEMLDYMVGEKLIITAPMSVKLKKITYRESGYNADVVGRIESSNSRLNTLINKATRTMLASIRNNIYECIERDRVSTAGVSSVLTPQILYSLGQEGVAIVAKALGDILPQLTDGGKDYGSLIALSEYGMLNGYYRFSGDKELIRGNLAAIVEYLKSWQREDKGLIVTISDKVDALHNIDERALINAVYYSALSSVKFLAAEVEDSTYDYWINDTRAALKSAYQKLWRGDGYCGCSDCNCDCGCNDCSCNGDSGVVSKDICESAPIAEDVVSNNLDEESDAEYTKETIEEAIEHECTCDMDPCVCSASDGSTGESSPMIESESVAPIVQPVKEAVPIAGKALVVETQAGGCSCGSDTSCYDDRANAWAILAGLAPNEYYGKLTRLLTNVGNASPYMEGFVLEALCLMGEYDLALRRMLSKYANHIDNANSTLWEDFYHLGSIVGAKSGGAMAVSYRRIVGAEVNPYNKTARFVPTMAAGDIKFCVPTPDGNIAGSYRHKGDSIIIDINNNPRYDIELVLNSKALGKEVEERVLKVTKHTKIVV